MAIDLKINKAKDTSLPKSEREWASLINQYHDREVTNRQSWEFQWAVNAAFYAGFQHLTFNPLIQHISRDFDNEAYIINRIAPFVESRVANLSKSKPSLSVLPEDNDPLVVQAAKLSTELLKHSWKVQDNDDKFVESMFWMVITGSVFWKSVWDPTAGEPISTEQNKKGETTFDKKGKPKRNVVFTGNTKTIMKTPFDILVPKGTRKLEKSPWLIDRIPMNLDQIAVNHPDADLDNIQADINQMTQFERFLSELNSPIFSSFVGLGGEQNNKFGPKEHDVALVKEFWMRPNKWYPEGIRAIVIGEQLVEFEAWPDELLGYPDDRATYPYVHMQEYRNPWAFYGYSSVTRLIPIQKHYNQYRTQLAVNSELMANVKWHAFKGSGLSEDALTDEAGEVVETNPNVGKPTQMEVAPLPNYVIENGRQDITDFRDVGGEREASQLPFEGITAGVALETAAELTNLGLIPIIRNIEKALINNGRLELIYANKHFTEERIIKLSEHDADVIVKKFKGADLKNQFDVRIMIDSAIAESKAANQQKIIDLWDRRMITDPKLALRAFSSGRVDMILQEDDPAMGVVVEQINQIKNGEQPTISPFDNHILHFQTLSKFVQSPEFRRMPPDRQKLALFAIQQHLSFLGQGAEQQPEQNQAAVGTPFGPQVPVGAGP